MWSVLKRRLAIFASSRQPTARATVSGVVPAQIEGYAEPEKYEFFMPEEGGFYTP